MGNKFYFYKNMNSGFSSRSYASIGSLKVHLRQYNCRMRSWLNQADQLLEASSFLASTHFYELDLETLETKVFTMALTDRNQWVRHD